MDIEIAAQSEGAPISIRINAFPSTCPICNKGMDPRFCYAYVHPDVQRAEVLFQCPRAECRHTFITYYLNAAVSNPPSGLFVMFNSLPQSFEGRTFSETILAISERFVLIFNQAFQAERAQLTEIVGAGYRRALEFLIKDYAIRDDAENAELIKSKLLGAVIREHVSDRNVKTTAERAAWVGNDETHYYRKWADKDLSDLKVLIELVVHWIESEELTRKYEREMTKK